MAIAKDMPTFTSIKKPKTRTKTGVRIAPALSGIRWATIEWVCEALSSIIFLIFPEGFKSKNLKLALLSPLSNNMHRQSQQ